MRLIGLDAPETADPRQPAPAYGQESSAFLKNLLAEETVWAEYDPDWSQRDESGRAVAYLYRVPDGMFVNLEIVRQGYGYALTEYRIQYLELFIAAEKRAREAHKGLWAIATGQGSSVPLSVLQQPISGFADAQDLQEPPVFNDLSQKYGIASKDVEEFDITEIIGDGKFIRLSNGSLWEVDAGESVTTSLWLPSTEVVLKTTVVVDTAGANKGKAFCLYHIVNVEDDEEVGVSPVNPEYPIIVSRK